MIVAAMGMMIVERFESARSATEESSLIVYVRSGFWGLGVFSHFFRSGWVSTNMKNRLVL